MAVGGPGDNDFNVKAGFEFNDAEARKQAEFVASVISKVLTDAFKDLAVTLNRSLSKTIDQIFDPSRPRQFAKGVDDATAATRRHEEANERLLADIKALTDSSAAFKENLRKVGASEDIFANIEAQFRKLLKLQETLETQFDRFGSDRKFAARIQKEFEQINNTIRNETARATKTLDTFTVLQRRASVSETDALNRESVERRQIRQQEHGLAITQLQTQKARELAEIRGSNAQALVSHRAASKARIAILEFTLRQIRTLERSIGKIFSASAAVIAGAFARIEGTVLRIGRVFRAQNNALTQGLQPALLSRERSISRSFISQETSIRSSVVRQEKLLQQLNTQASRGVVGAATGRSSLGGLLGGGLAIGGGFALITKLKQGFTETVNLNEALNKTQQIFGDATAEIQAFADNSVEALFVTKSAALAAAADFGIFGKSAGLAGPELANFSKTLTLLATDLASFNNTTIEDATTALSAALRGESEPIRKYGVLLNEAVLQQRAMAIGVTDTIRKLQPFERVLAANAEILAQTRIQQGDAARTADDFANSSRRAAAASVEFFASIARVAVPLATVITNGLFPAFQNMTKFILNEVSPALQVVRQGAIGAAAGIGALLIAKTAGEALRFLALSLRFVLTPMGAVVAAFALIGAAINILVNRSPELRRIFDDIRESVGERLSQGLELASRFLDRIGDVITETVIPAAFNLATLVRERLLQAFRATVGFVRDTVIPAFERFGAFIRDVLFPKVVEVARAVKDRLTPAFEAVVEFIQPAIDAFVGLGGAIRDVFTGVGDFSAVLDAIEDFGVRGAIIAGAAGLAIAAAFINPFAGIAVAIAGIGVAFGPELLAVIRPQVERLREFLTDFFSAGNLSAIGISFLGVVRRIGEILGSIVSDPRFIKALEAIVAAAVAVGGSFVLGFAQGVANNLPELGRLLGGQFLTALKAAFKFALSNPDVILGALAALLLGSKVKALFARFGTEGATSFGKGFIGGIGRGAATQAGLLRGVFGSTANFEETFRKNGEKAGRKLKEGLTREFQAINRDLVRLGQTIPNILPKGGITDEVVADRNKQLNAARESIGLARTEGALFTARFGESLKGLGDIAKGFARILGTDVKGGLTQVQAGASTLRLAVRDAFRDMQAAGVSTGQALGAGVLAGFGAAISGNIAGSSSSGTGQALGIAGILGSALSVSQIPGVGIPLAGLTLALGGLFTVLGANERATKKAKEEMQEYASALKDAETNAEALKGVGSVLEENLRNESQAVQDILATTSFSFESFTNDVLSGSVNARKIVDEFFLSLGAGGAEARRVLAADQGLDTFAEIQDAIEHGGSALSEATQKALRDSEFSFRDFVDALDALGDETSEILKGARAEESIARFRQEVRLAAGDITSATTSANLFEARIITASEAMTVVVGSADRMEAAIQGANDEFKTFADQETDRRVKEFRTGLDQIDQALESLSRRRTENLTNEIEKVSDKMKEARDTATLARDAIASFFTGGTEETASTALDAAVNNALSIGQALGEALAKPDQLSKSAIADVFRQFNDQVGAIATRAFEENPALDSAGLLAQLQPLFQGIKEAAGLDTEDLFTPEVAQRLIDEIQGKLSDNTFTGIVDLASQAQQAADDLQDEIDRLNVALEIPVQFSTGQIRGELIRAGFSPQTIANLLPLSNVREIFDTVGFEAAGGTADGFERGIEAGTVRVETAARNMATAAELALADQLDAHSPSRVFQALGITIPEGIVAGIEAGSPDALVALRELSSELFARLVFLPGTISEAFASVLEEVPGALDAVSSSLDPVSESMERFAASTFEAISNLESLKDADLSRIGVGLPEGANPLSNAGRVANRFAGDLASRFNASAPHPPGWVQTEDGTWVPPSFFAPAPLPPNPLSAGLDRPEGSVVAAATAAAVAAVQAIRQTEQVPGVNVENLTITETQNARVTGRETVMALTAASLGA